MKHPIGAAVALALGVCVAGAAHAQTNHGQSTAHPNGYSAQATMQHGKTTRPMSHAAMAKQAQQWLKSAGFYHGRIDGKWGPESRQALIRFERQHNLPVSGALNQTTYSALERNVTVGVGSSMPRQQGAGTATKPTPQSMPGPTQAPGAGGNAAPAGSTNMQH